MYFNGKRVCLDERSVQLLSSGVGTSGFDKSAGMLKVTYRSGDTLFDDLVSKLGVPMGNMDYLSYSLMVLNESEISKYNKHELIQEAFERTGSFNAAVIEDVNSGFIKVQRRMETYAWQIFRKPTSPEDGAYDLWVGDCMKLSNSLKCSFFYVYENYLIEVDLAENFLLKKTYVKKEIESDIKNNLFCEFNH